MPFVQSYEVTSSSSRTAIAWIRPGGTIAWPPRPPDLTSQDFSVWGYVKDRVFVPPLPASLEELQAWITEAVATVMRT